ncbi:HlyD family type I secretion periplasmic adaptor subunit [Pseudomonas sp. zfem002]|uniref:HlyD family type I secretion periplasmic adaptor subunit n=1 Tax=Pseudomonas sp. zfem002 TaxID=3078197 RepID=UPI002929F1FC|nr:HlyD family type I secretion periplasmic adaptor subunit [Pseudomonas sp. zfem002]MDU9394070.1 HlyD family type I secretion periplasmic adaptor subunit [Pseudomonas sp. zfem002]
MSMAEPSAKRELWQRYRYAWSQAWRRRKELDAAPRLAHEVQFLPAALALQEQPVHPAPRYIQWLIMLFAVLALAWACLGEIEVVATARGKVVASGKSKTIQPSEVAVVKAIRVYDGQEVKAGDVLVELDASVSGADVRRLRSELLAAQVDRARASALLEAIQGNREPGPLAAYLPDAGPEQVQAAQRWLQGQYLEMRSALDQVSAEIDQRSAEIQSARAMVASLQKTLPITRRLAEDYRVLLEQQYVPRHAYLEKQQALLDQERDLAVQQARVVELSASRKEAERRREGTLAQTRRSMLDLQQQAQQQAASLTQELKKAEQRDHLMRLVAPVDGTVQQLAIHTVGGVVTAAQALMVVVPSDQPVEVEAMLENKDVGFVREGQQATVKVETFTFTKYGTVEGEVLSVSNDAIEDEKRGLIYSSRVRLLKDYIRVRDQQVALSPGMSVTVEIKTDRRKVIDYFLSPLQQYVDESLRER